MPAFWNILGSARKQGVSLHNLSSHGKYILSSSFDKQEYDHILSFLGVEPVNDEWYAKCIQGSNLVSGVSEDVYLDILLFLADNCIYACTQRIGDKTVSLSRYSRDVSWLIDWSKEFRCAANQFFMPGNTQEAIRLFSKKATLLQWLQDYVEVGYVDVYDYAVHLSKSINADRKLAIAFVHFLYHSLLKNHMSKGNPLDDLCGIMPLVDSYGNVITERKVVLVPASGSKWVALIGSNPWRGEGYVELGEEYLYPGLFAGEFTSAGQLLEFLTTHVAASDIPYVSPPNAAIPAVSAHLVVVLNFKLLNGLLQQRHRLQGVKSASRKHKVFRGTDGRWIHIDIAAGVGSEEDMECCQTNEGACGTDSGNRSGAMGQRIGKRSRGRKNKATKASVMKDTFLAMTEVCKARTKHTLAKMDTSLPSGEGSSRPSGNSNAHYPSVRECIEICK
ncbi:hypothetical protein CJ030_MR6G023564 [Morella rubra]|uniref:Uncharacterized protein n=1 Tax=Morella rubra TaxID=262757 RepID=A0A6A1VBW0_9ROSI|nr:hypothetical protein CJ030_MR6G023564 [Morella rubra]